MAFTMKNGPSLDERSLNFLMGEVMKRTQGKANPLLARQLLLERLDSIAEVSSSTTKSIPSP